MVGSGYVVKLGDFGMARAMYDSDYYRFGRKGKANIIPCSYFMRYLSDPFLSPFHRFVRCYLLDYEAGWRLAGGWLAAGEEGGCGATGPSGLTGAERDLWHWQG